MRRLARPWAGLAAIVAGSAALLAIGTSQVREWLVMTDELLFAKLAHHTATTGSPVPVLHGVRDQPLGIVYPLILAPFYAAFDAPSAFRAAHIVNAVLFASAAIPVYLLGRRLVGQGYALVVSLLAVAVPWCVSAGVMMSEAAAYPVFVWAVLALHLALSEPSGRRDGLAIGALILAFFTRPQFLFLAAVLPLAALVVDGRRCVQRHRVLAVAYAAGLLVVLPLAALGEADRLLGDYAGTATEGSILPLIAFKSAALHVDVLAVGLAIIPFLLGAGWAYSRLRDASTPRRAFAALTALSIPLLALEAGSYGVRFGGPDVIRDRYVFYLAPLLLLATAVCLSEPRLPLAGIAGATIFFAVTVAFADFTPVAGLWIDSPQSVLNGVIRGETGGLPTGVFVALCGVAIGAICLCLVFIPRPARLLGVTAVVFAFGAALSGYAYHRLLNTNTPLGIPITGQDRVRDWVDRATRQHVALLAYPVSRDWGQSAILWWDTELWNDDVDHAFVGADGTFTYTPFPAPALRLDFDSGVFSDTESAPPFVLAAANDSRFGLRGTTRATNLGLVLQEVERPYRATWASRGLDPDGWTRPGHPATVRTYGEDGLVRIALTLDAPPEATEPTRYRVGDQAGTVDPGQRATVEVQACREDGHADVQLMSSPAATIAGPPLGPEPGPPRTVGVVLSGVSATPTNEPCHP